MAVDKISVVIPVYNEEQSISEGYAELSSIMQRMGCPYELVYVDDGSRDTTLERLKRLALSDPSLKVIELRRNFGQTAAMAAGLENTTGDIVITLDGDLQNDPAEIPAMVSKLQEGYDMVAGWRKFRKDPFINRKLPSMIANWVISKFTRVQLHDYGCTLKAMSGEVARGIRLYGEMHRFIPALADEMGARIAEVPVNHRARLYGSSKYGISRTIRVILDLMTVKFLLSFSKRPIHLFGPVGLVSGALGGLMLAWAVYQRFFEHVPMGNRPIVSLAVMLVLVGLQFLVFGLLAEILARTYHESQGKPIYVIRRIFQGAVLSDPAGSRRSVEETWKRAASM